MTDDHILESLSELIETCKDGQLGFTACAAHVHSPALRQVLLTYAGDCALAADELMQRYIDYGGQADVRGSTSSALHRGWVKLRGSLLGYTDQNMLEECEHNEDMAMQRYQRVLQANPMPELLRALIERQLLGLKRNRDQIKALCDQAHVNA
jgi:uncharacterized protein (TIGR02284 family)